MFEYGIHFWLVLGVLLGIIEVLTVAFFALPFALGAIVTAIFAAFGMPMNGQLMVFAISSVIMIFLVQFLVRKYLLSKEGSDIKTNFDALVGREALVMEPIDGEVRRGAVKIGGEIWSAISRQDNAFEKDEVVRVTGVEGAKVLVTGRDEAPEQEE